jgi:hypothetical protein
MTMLPLITQAMAWPSSMSKFRRGTCQFLSPAVNCDSRVAPMEKQKLRSAVERVLAANFFITTSNDFHFWFSGVDLMEVEAPFLLCASTHGVGVN